MSNAASAQTPVRRRSRLEVSLNGIIYIVLALFMGVAAVNSQANLLFGVFGLMLGVLAISGMVSRSVLSRLRVRRVMPETAVVGQSLKIGYECSNEKRYWPSLSVTLSEMEGSEAFIKQPVAYMLHAAAHHTAVAPTEIIPKRRGLHTLDRVQISTSFPFGFFKRARDRSHRQTLLVYPAIGSVSPQLLRLCRSGEQGWAQLRPRRGGSNEFYGVKEFRQGENPRFIHWKRSARTGVLVSKEMTRVAPPRLALLVDTCLDSKIPESAADVERAIAMAASLANVALESGLVVGLCAWSGHWVTLPGNRGKRHCRDLMTVLAQLRRNTNHGSAELLDAGSALMSNATTAVLITPAAGAPRQATEHRGFLVLSATDPRATSYFEFDRAIDFSMTMPVEKKHR